VRAFSRRGHRADATFSAIFEADEAGMLRALAEQITDLLDERDNLHPNPAVARLLPDAYPEDAEASAEFRRFTADGLAERKMRNARVLADSVAIVADSPAAGDGETATEVVLNAQEAQAWIRSLTDIRLTIATQLGIETDDDLPKGQPELLDLYDWLGFVQSSLVDELMSDELMS
jgi:hypothetical protein